MGTNENKPDAETVADIVREMREMKCHSYADVAMHADFCGYADRIEAAAKRDKDATEADALYVGAFVEATRHKACDASAMREALEMFVNNASCLNHCDIHRFYPETTSCDGVLADEGECPMKTECDAVFKGRAALSAPARNCDRFATRSDAWDAFAATYFGPTDPGEMEYHFGVWLFAKAEGGAE